MKFTAIAPFQFIKLFILFCAVLFSVQTIAQSPLNKRYSKETRVYQLNKTQFINVLYNRAEIDSLEIFKNYITSFSSDSLFDYTKLPFGHYLEIKAVEGNMVYSTKSNSFFNISSFGVNGETWLIVANNKDELITNAKVSINDETYTFLDDCGCYPIPVKKANGLILVEYEGFYEYRNISSYKPPKNKYTTNNANYRNTNYNSSIRILPGYIATNKPKYRLLDTVKLKAFLVNENGKPWTSPVTIKLRDENQNKTIHETKSVKSKSNGAFVYEFVIADTVQIDRDYTLAVYNNSGSVLLKKLSIRVEDYELEDSDVYLSYPVKPKFYTGENLAFWMSAKDANQLPLMDVRVQLKLKLIKFIKTEERSFYIPDKWYTNLFDTTFIIDASGEHLLKIPGAILPNGDFNIACEVRFTNSKNKLEIRNYTFEYSAKKENYEMKLRGDSLEASFAYKAKKLPQENCVLAQYRYNKLIKETPVNLPFKTKLDLETTQYKLLKDGAVLAELNLPDQVQNLIFMEGEKSNDSIKITLNNTLGATVNYRIFKKDNQVFGGRNTSFTFLEEDKTLDSYHVIYSTFWHGTFYIWESAFHIQEKEISVDIDQKVAIYPGEEVTVKIAVSDYKKRALKNVNLTAYAVNMKFGEIPIPDLPYFGRIHHGLLSTFEVTNTAAARNSLFIIEHKHLAQFNLSATPYYQFAFNTNGLGFYNDSINSTWAEFTPYVFNGGVQPIYAIYLNNKPVYLHGMNKDMQQTAKVKPGVYHVKMRTVNDLYSIKDVELKAGIKTSLCINTNFAEANKRVNKTKIDSVPFTQIEENYLTKYFLLMRTGFGENIFLEQDSLVVNYFGNNSGYNLFVDQNRMGWTKLGPFKKGMINVTNFTTDTAYSFYFEPGYFYRLNRDTLEVTKPDIVPDPFKNTYFRNKTAYWRFNERAAHVPQLHKIVVQNNLKAEIKKIEETPINIDNPVRNRQLRTAPPQGVETKNRCLFNVHNQTDKFPKWLLIWDENRKKESAVWYGRLPYNTYTFEGNYTLTCLFNDSSYIRKSVSILDSGQNFIQLKADEMQPYDSTFIYQQEDKIAALNKAPLVAFNSPPHYIKTFNVSYVKTKDGKAMLSGYILNYRINPINSAVLFLENRGKFVAGAITNRDGYFEMPNVKPGRYALKIRLNAYDAWEISEIIVLANRETKILIQEKIPQEVRLYANAVSDASGIDDIDLYGDKMIEVGKTSDVKTVEQITNLPIRGSAGIAAMTPGVMVGDDGNLRFRGARSGSSQVFIDGVKVRGDANLPRESIQMQEVMTGGLPASYGNVTSGAINYTQMGYSSGNVPDEYAEFMFTENSTRGSFSLLPLKADKQTNGIRKEFRDYAFWQPNLITNKQGEAFFTVKFPDNITQWKTIVPAMNGKKQTGLNTTLTQAYKPLSAVLALPYYLVDGDNLTIEGNILNYLEDSIQVKYWLNINEDTLAQSKAKVLGFKKEEWNIALDQGTQNVTFGILEGGGYKDGEQRKVNVYANGVEETIGERWLNRKDSSYVYLPNPNLTSRVLFITNTNLDIYKMELAALKSYKYGCNEQTASKLTALLLEKKMLGLQGLPFKDERAINKSIRILERNQNKDGSYGWWGKSAQNIFITTYVIKALNASVEDGYRTKAHMKAAAFLKGQLPKMDVSDKLESLDALSAIPYPSDFAGQIKTLDSINLTYVDALLLTQIKQRLGMAIDLSFILDSVETTKNGSFWGEDLFNIKTNKWRTSMLAYSILHAEGGYDSLLTSVRAYFLSKKLAQRNTLERASMLSQFMDDLLENNSFENEVKGNVLINNREINKYPFIKEYSNTDTVAVSVSGKPIQVLSYTNQLNVAPLGIDSILQISSYFVQNAKVTDSLIWNRPVTMIVEVDIEKTSEYILIEVPIPASCSYDPNTTITTNSNELYREQFRDMTSIACGKLRPGKHKFVISLIPRFKGTFNVLPAEAGNMYFPELRNYSKPKIVWVLEK